MKKISIGSNIFANTATANIDAKYGIYESKEEAYECLGENGADVIALGLTVGIMTQDGIEEYWWKNGTRFSDLVPKSVNDGSSEILRRLSAMQGMIERSNIIIGNIYDRLVAQEEAQGDDEWEEI